MTNEHHCLEMPNWEDFGVTSLIAKSESGQWEVIVATEQGRLFLAVTFCPWCGVRL
jgi:hypothetical protein